MNPFGVVSEGWVDDCGNDSQLTVPPTMTTNHEGAGIIPPSPAACSKRIPWRAPRVEGCDNIAPRTKA